jgi:hypothetical protein
LAAAREAGNAPPSKHHWPLSREFDASRMSVRPVGLLAPQSLVNHYVRLRNHMVLESGAVLDAGLVVPVVAVDAQARTLTVQPCERMRVPGVPFDRCDLVLCELGNCQQ